MSNQQEFLKDLNNPLIQTFDDVRIDDKKRNNRQLAQVFPYDSDRINKLQEQGAGGYVAINPTTNGNRDISHLKYISAIGLDLDVCKEEEHLNEGEIKSRKMALLEKLREIPFKPHRIIETKNGIQPVYRVKPFTNYSSPEEANELYRGVVDGMCRLIDVKSEGDNVVRVIRLPDTKHLKDPQNPFINKLIYTNHNQERYDFNVFIEHFKQKEKIEPAQEVAPLITRRDDLISQILALPLIEVIQNVASVGGIDATFRDNTDGSKQIVENGEVTSGFVSSRGEFCYSSSGKDRKGNQITVAEYYLGVPKKEAIKWLKNKFHLSEMKPTERVNNYKLLSLDELYGEKEVAVEWAVEALMPKDGTIIISGHPGIGKSWIVLHIAVCIAQNGSVFNKFPSQQATVLMIDEENHQRDLVRRAQKLGATKDLPIYFLIREGFNIERDEDLEFILQEIKEKGAEVVIFDSFVRIHSGDENDAGSIAKVFRRLSQINRLGCTVILTHHHRKQIQFGSGLPAQNMRGSSDILAAVDCHIAIEKKDQTLTIKQTKLRQAQEQAPFEIKIYDNEEDNVVIEYIGLHDEMKLKIEETKDVLMRLFEENKGQIEFKEIKEKIGTSGKMYGEKTIRKALESLIEEHRIRKITVTRGKYLYSYLEPDQGAEILPF